MTAGFSATARRLGIVSAIGVVAILVAYAVTLVAGFASLESPGQPIGDAQPGRSRVGYVGVFPVVAGLLAVLFYRTVPVVAPAAPSPEK